LRWYCEAGVLVPDLSCLGLAFDEWNTVNYGENRTELQNSTSDGVLKGNLEGGIAGEINRTLEKHPDWQFDPDKGFVNKTKDVEE
jgi:hypothetical protein